jgi:photosystem II stability/assembly factor-like uncharacterized protein
MMRSDRIAHLLFLLLAASVTACADEENEDLGDWQRRESPVMDDLNDVTFTSFHRDGQPALRGIIVGDGGTVLVSEDKGASWHRQEIATSADLHVIRWVNDVVYVGGDGVVLMSRDAGRSFAVAGDVGIHVRDMAYHPDPSSAGVGTFWAVGDQGAVRAARLGSQGLEGIDPAALRWEPVDVGTTADLRSIDFDFLGGLIVGEGGLILESFDGRTFAQATGVSTKAELYVVRDGLIGGERSIMRRSPLDGAPGRALHWSARESSELPAIRDVVQPCLDRCLAVAADSEGSLILELDTEDGTVAARLASGIAVELRAIARVAGSDWIVGEGGTLLTRGEVR